MKLASKARHLIGALRHKNASALVINESDLALLETVEHLKRIGFTRIVIAGLTQVNPLAPDDIPYIPLAPDTDLADLLSKISSALVGQWFHFCFNGEFLHFPFSETRTIDDFCGFLGEERRASAQTIIVDLYSEYLRDAPNVIKPDQAFFDAAPYYYEEISDLTLEDAEEEEVAQALDIYGGLRWRHSEYFPEDRQILNRAALIKGQKGVLLNPDLTFADLNLRSLACPWHRSPTTAMTSFRALRYLYAKPSARSNIDRMTWSHAQPSKGDGQQLSELGFFEYGQWF